VEIERKFLVPDLPAALERYDASDVRQGYLAVEDDGTEVRLRDRDGTATLTVKKGRGEVRSEEEIEIGSGDFDRLWPLTDGRRVEKRRHLIPAGGDLTIELDVYAGDLHGLATAEVEFGSEADSREFEPPDWFGRELTGDARFSNQRLAVDGIPG
jgi:CYTH domain-containing protein